METIPMFDYLPQTDEPKKTPSVNCLQEILNELMDVNKVEAADIHRATGIAYTTIHDWIHGNVRAQLADRNLLKLAQYFNVSLEYLCFGIGDSVPVFEKFKDEFSA